MVSTEMLKGSQENMCWWTVLGYSPFEEGKGGFPQTGQVIKHYRENKMNDASQSWTQKRLAEVLEVTEKTIGEIENRDSFLGFDRRRHLCQLLAIPPLLLGIRTREEIDLLVEEHRAKNAASGVEPISPSSTVWWVELGYPEFETGKDGFFPRTGQVVKHYRGLKTDHKGKAWTQRLLAQTLGLTDQAVWDLENRDIGMDFDRRQFLSDLFEIPPVLLGIITAHEIDRMIEEKKAVQPMTPVVSKAAQTSHRLLIDVEEYTALLEGDFTTFISDPAHLCMQGVDARIDALYRELPHVKDEKPLQALLCRYHDFVANVLLDQREYDDAIVHWTKGLRLAKRVRSGELTVLMLYGWGSTLWAADRVDEAVQKYEEARRYERALPNNLLGCLLLDTGCVGAMVAQTPQERTEAIALMDRVGKIVRNSWKDADPYFLHFNLDRYHLTRAFSLMAVGWNNDAIEELQLVQAGPEHPRRQALCYIYQAQALTNLGEYEEVVSLAETGLVVAQQINSEALIARVERISQQLKASSYKNSSDVARLEYLLRKW
jgi:transcriptional regulator with XRE-family HTH domain